MVRAINPSGAALTREQSLRKRVLLGVHQIFTAERALLLMFTRSRLRIVQLFPAQIGPARAENRAKSSKDVTANPISDVLSAKSHHRVRLDGLP